MRRLRNEGRLTIERPDQVGVVEHTTHHGRGRDTKSVRLSISVGEIEASVVVDAPVLIDELTKAEEWRAA